MSKSRRTFTKEFKTKVVLEALRERTTIEELAKKHELLPTQISIWKAEAVKNLANVFGKDKTEKAKDSIPTEKLYAEIGQLKMENDYLKKSCVDSTRSTY